MPEGTTANIEHLTNGAWNNSDGHGFAVHCGNKIITGHGMDFEQVLDQFLEVRKRNHGHAIFHSRITTHGLTNIDNCHPFRVGGDPRTVIGHNGVLPIQVPKGDNRSDTRIFADTYLPSIGGVYALDEPDTFASLEKWAAGSKLVVLTTDEWAQREFYIINEKDGHWDTDGVWWSNNSYKYRWGGYSSYSKTSKYDTYDSGWKTYVSSSKKYEWTEQEWEEEESYWNLYEVTCPVCETKDVWDFDTEDPITCPTCECCMWCQMPENYCECYSAKANTPPMSTPDMRKITGNELKDLIYFDEDEATDVCRK
jgi:glutamine amidotransferase